MLKVKVISREMIKPSSPTPHDLRTHKLTLLDQSLPSMYIPLLFFYPINDCDSSGVRSVAKTQLLKKSLSESLTLYYPLAGRMKEGDSVVECNDEGVEFSEARVGGQLSEFLKQPHVEVLDRMVPCNVHNARSGAPGLVLAVQLNWFDSGGMAIGGSVHHRIGDAAAMGAIINGWANASRCIFKASTVQDSMPSPTQGLATISISDGRANPLLPDFQSAKTFPTEGSVPTFHHIIKDNVVGKRFVFSAPKIEALRAGPSMDLQVRRPTRIEAVSALIWGCIIRTQGGDGSMGVSFASHFVNLRGRMLPPLPEHSFGNIVFVGTAMATRRECDNEEMQCCLEQKLRDAIRGVHKDRIKEFQKPDGILRAHEYMISEVGKYRGFGVNLVYFSSWCGFSFYEADFGWGKPVWVSLCTVPIKNLIFFTRTSGGDGIEAWVNMEDVDMAKFEQDKELLRFVSTPPVA